eukprot:jgi/Botrbrau1/19010/Bobra.0100s0042.1
MYPFVRKCGWVVCCHHCRRGGHGFKSHSKKEGKNVTFLEPRDMGRKLGDTRILRRKLRLRQGIWS